MPEEGTQKLFKELMQVLLNLVRELTLFLPLDTELDGEVRGHSCKRRRRKLVARKIVEMNQINLDIQFLEAFERLVSSLSQDKAVAPDVMLKLYAYNKQANFGNNFLLTAGQMLETLLNLMPGCN